MLWGKGSVAEAALSLSNLSDFPRTDNVKVEKSPISGLGVFATKNLEPGTLITTYAGRLVGPKEKRFMAPGDKSFLMKLDKKKSIDGSDLDNLGRYFNHKCSDNNCETFRLNDEIRIKTVKYIRAGEELTFSYGTRYWNDPERICLCGTLNCCSVI